MDAFKSMNHWSKGFPKPQQSTKMTGATGMTDGNGKPSIEMARWHKGKLYMAGMWPVGVDASGTVRDVNISWNLWSWNPSEGYRPLSWRHSANGGPGPAGVINDFLFLPDDRIVVGGEFLSIGNLRGHSYHRIKGLAIYNPNEPTGTRWCPFSNSVQHNGPGTVQTLAYDPKANDLWVGGSFSGYRMDPEHREQFCYAVMRYNLGEKKWYIMPPGLRGGTVANRIKVDVSTEPSTIYISGRFSHTGGDGEAASDRGTARYSTGFCAWRQDVGWITFPKNHTDAKLGHDGILQRAGDYAFFDSVNIFDFLVDGKDIWIVGAFSEGKTNNGKPLRGIAKWDAELEAWIDPTLKGGFGREAYSIAKTEDGKIYVAGAFGGEKGKELYNGFKNGDLAHMVACFDPNSGTWGDVGNGLGGFSMPVCRLTAVKNDVFVYGTFKNVGRDPKKEGFESYYIARWNEYVDFSKENALLPDSDSPYNIVEPPLDEPEVKQGLEHWSRVFAAPNRAVGGKSQQSAKTGMDNGTGTPDVKVLQWYEGTLYIGGSWEAVKGERWYVWTYHAERGWEKMGWQKGGEKHGFASIPSGLKWHEGKMYVYGSNEEMKGMAIFDPKSQEWSPFTGTYLGNPIRGNGAQGNPPINDIAWDSRTGDIYLVGACGENIRYMSGHSGGTVPSQVLRVDKDNVYHPMGLMLLAQNPSKPDLSFQCILLDETKNPTDIYLGGCFGFKGADSNHKNAVYNVAKWNHDEQDWGPIGKGDFWRIGMHDKKTFPHGQPGLKAQPIYGFPTFLKELWPVVRCLSMDKEGNLYAGGAVGILDDNPDINQRCEQYGIVKYDVKLDRWVGACASNCRGVSRDVFQMSWLDDTHLLLTGGFLYSEDFRLLNNIAILDITSGALEPLSGGVQKAHDAHVYSCNVVHTLAEDGYWFGGFFQFAAVGPKSQVQSPIESNYIAHYHPNLNLDPNGELSVTAPPPIKGVKGYNSENRDVKLAAQNIPEGGTVTWYQLAQGKPKKLGTGPVFTAKVRVSGKDTSFTFYAANLSAQKVEGGKIPVVVPVEAP